MNLAILLSTCDAYLPMAEFTLRRLDDWWPAHPQVHVCGVTAPRPPFDRCLPVAADPRDWVGIALDAVLALQRLGVEWLYLILDDHPPFGPCDADYLNRRMPENAAALGAVQVNLLGWDQFQPHHGEVLGPERLCWQRNASSFQWKFSLHPGLWPVLPLRAMLESLRGRTPGIRSARAFEGGLDDACRALDPVLLTRTYRVKGDGFAVPGRWYASRAARAVIRRLIDGARLAAGAPGRRPLAAVDDALAPYLRYVNGPYPLFWSGLLRQGRLHEEALRFLRWSGQAALADDARTRGEAVS